MCHSDKGSTLSEKGNIYVEWRDTGRNRGLDSRIDKEMDRGRELFTGVHIHGGVSTPGCIRVGIIIFVN